jgi:hypothetical protein
MKKLILMALPAVLLLHGILSAQELNWAARVQKDYSRSYPVNNASIELVNRYGAMQILTWDKNEVKVEAKISVQAQKDVLAQAFLDKIHVVDSADNNRIVFRTKIDPFTYTTDNGDGGYSMQIDYTVHVPANASISADNSFGNLLLGDFNGKGTFRSRYGQLIAGVIAQPVQLTVEFGKASIQSMNGGECLFRYSRIDIQKLSGELTGKMEFCNSVDLPLDNSIRKLELKNNYTSLYLVTSREFAADYEIATHNARLSAKSEWQVTEANTDGRVYQSPRQDRLYKGSLGKGGNTRISIDSRYGNIRIL